MREIRLSWHHVIDIAHLDKDKIVTPLHLASDFNAVGKCNSNTSWVSVWHFWQVSWSCCCQTTYCAQLSTSLIASATRRSIGLRVAMLTTAWPHCCAKVQIRTSSTRRVTRKYPSHLRVHCAHLTIRPLHYAAVKGNDKCVKLLLEHHADANLRTPANQTALLVALQTMHSEKMKDETILALLEHEATDLTVVVPSTNASLLTLIDRVLPRTLTALTLTSINCDSPLIVAADITPLDVFEAPENKAKFNNKDQSVSTLELLLLEIATSNFVGTNWLSI